MSLSFLQSECESLAPFGKEVDTVDTVYTVDFIYTVDTFDMAYTVDMVYTAEGAEGTGDDCGD